ncbi:hypothetical protein [Streptomyces sp. 2P-4]|uniref:hypothetical protein n=1 Tax=Streptomyces sp. 2P-4 TaxID=2931974 RepID=UPI002540F196|nr:hypothetical protein [Streptomyces sp. 2P-4]
MRKAVTTHTLSVFAAATAAGMTFADITVLLVRMTSAQVSAWKWVGDEMRGEDPVEGYEVRDTTGALLGVILPLGHKGTRLHTEWYDPQADDLFPAGETANVTTQGIARILDARTRNVGAVPTGEDFAPAPVQHIRNQACPFSYCFDAECVDHGPVWAEAA